MEPAHSFDKPRAAVALFVGVLALVSPGCRDRFGGENPGEYNAAVEAPIPDDPALGTRAHTGGLAVQLPKGASKTDKGGHDVYRGDAPAKWTLTIARLDSYSGDSYPALANMLETVHGSRGKMRAPADARRLGPYAAERLVVDTRSENVDLTDVIYEIPYHDQNKQGVVYQLTYVGRREDADALIPLFDECAQTIVLKE